MKIPSVPTFLMKADRKLTAAVSTAICSEVESSTRSRRRIALSIMPETAIARLTTRTDAMMMMTGLAKPTNAFFAGTTPVRTAADRASAATRS